MKERQVWIGVAVYYLLFLAWWGVLRPATFNVIDGVFLGTFFPVVPFIAFCLLHPIRRRAAAEAAHAREIALQDRLARRIAVETNGPAVKEEDLPQREPVGFRVNR